MSDFQPNGDLLIRLTRKLPLLPLLVYIIDLYDPYGKAHSRRVAELAGRLAKAYHYQDVSEIELSALLHDVGKIGIPESIRRLSGKFTDAERLLMQQHPQIGERLLTMVIDGVVSQIVIDNVRHHHENWDGSGYPDNLKSDAIPLGSRIVRICDSYDAITHVRGYAQPRTHAEALTEMRSEQALRTVYDPELFKIFMDDSFWLRNDDAPV